MVNSMGSDMAVASNSDPRDGEVLKATTGLSGAVSDLVEGLSQWRIWWTLAFGEIRQRYRRSRLGQFWLTISLLAMIGGIGLVYSLIFGRPIAEYLPFLGVGLIVWNLLLSLVNDLSTCFISAESHLRSYPSPRSVIIYRTISRDFIVSAHNFLIVPLLIILFQVPVTFAVFLVIPALLLIAFNAVWVGMLLGTLCTRFRDLPPIIASIMQVAFFLTPILYRPAQLQEKLWVVTHLNPFASFVEIVRAPLLGEVPALHHYLFALLCTVVGWSIALPFYARFRRRIVYWL
jgi:homopolymeric O-antigen transport system permease protein